MLRRQRPDQERSRGQVIAEFTIVIPLFILIVLGIAEGGYYVAASTIVNSATHEGARLGVLETTSSRDTIRNRVKDAAGPIVAVASNSITLKLAAANEDGTHGTAVACDNTCYGERKKDDLLIVDVDYKHTPLVGYVFPDFSFPAPATAELTVEGDAA